MGTMGSVNTSPNPRAARIRSRSAAGTGSVRGRTSKVISVLGLVVIAGPSSRRFRATADWAPWPGPGGPAEAGRAAVLSLPRGNAAASRDRWPEEAEAPAATRLPGYSPGDVVTDLRGDPGRPGALALNQVVRDGLLDPGRLSGQVAQHRANEPCATCHSMIDPAGFALENFDAI